ncbi:ATP-binding protein [Nocardia tengchongensis]|uniref:ATP-binding protein n=1 Tax=Nocardia tengchongensis TaxID=2055889 RepID=UPI0036922D54
MLTLSPRLRGIPAPAASFVGREIELRDVGELLGRARLVSLVGPGGVGKTRLALEYARAHHDHYRDGTVLVELAGLAGLTDPALLSQTVLHALGVPESEGRPVLDLLIDYLADREILVILDTCEHLLDACAELAEALLQETADVQLLLTSRQPLGIPGEHLFPIGPLGVGSENGGAIELFAQRAAAVAPGFRLDGSSRAQVAEVCRRLDGIPLAVELAAVRLRVTSLRTLAGDVGNRFGVVAVGRRHGANVRHRTLHAAIEWSYDLCSDAERLLWQRLSVFAGSFDPDAAREVCADELLPADDVHEHLFGLADKSVLTMTEDGGRYRILDTLRQFGADRLAGSGVEEAIRQRHLDHFLALGREVWTHRVASGQRRLIGQVDADRDNIRAALDFAMSRPARYRDGLALSAYSILLLGFSGRSEAEYWLDRGLVAVPEPCPERALALALTVQWSFATRPERVPALLEEMRWCLEAGTSDSGDLALAPIMGVYLHIFTGVHHLMTGAVAAADTEFEAGRNRLDALGFRGEVAIALKYWASGLFVSGAYDACLTRLENALAVLDGIDGECWQRANVLLMKAAVLWVIGQREQAPDCARTAVALMHELGLRHGLAAAVDTLAWLTAEQGRFHRAAQLSGAANSLWDGERDGLFGGLALHTVPWFRESYDATVERARRELGKADYTAEFAKGATLDADRIAGLAGTAGDEPLDAVISLGPSLTPRETEVAALITEGLTNREISTRLGVSKRTVDAHIEHILSKLGFASRAQVAAYIAGNGFAPDSRFAAEVR